MKWVKRIGIALGLLIALLAALPFVVSIEDYRPRIEQELSARLKEPVTLARLRAHALPAPHASAEGISIGKNGDVKVAKLTIAPDLWSLVGETKVIRYVELSGVQVTQAGLDKLAALAKVDPKAPKTPVVRIGEVKVGDAVVLTVDFERRDGQLFIVDVDLGVDTRAAAISDDLSQTVNYAAVAADVVAIIGTVEIVFGEIDR